MIDRNDLRIGYLKWRHERPEIGSYVRLWSGVPEHFCNSPVKVLKRYRIIKYYPHCVHLVDDNGQSHSPCYFEFASYIEHLRKEDKNDNEVST